MELINECFYGLANAIIKQAAQNYVKAKKRLKKRPRNVQAQETVNEVLRFFYSDWFFVLTNVNADYIIKRLDKTIKTNGVKNA